MTGKDIIAVPSALGDKVGAIVWWRLSGGLDLDKLRAAWADKGLDPAYLPENPSYDVAFSRACKEHRDTHQLVRSLESGGFAIVAERAKGTALDYDVSCRCWLDAVKRVRYEGDSSIGEKVVEDYQFHQTHINQQDVSVWLCKTVGKLQAVALRDTGGVYFVPAHTLPEWEPMCEAVKAATQHKVLGVPAMRCDEAVEAALDAIANETQESTQHLEEVFARHEQAVADDARKGKLGPRALDGRITDATDIEEKLSKYEAVLGASLPKLHDAIDNIRARLTRAVLSAQAEQPADGYV